MIAATLEHGPADSRQLKAVVELRHRLSVRHPELLKPVGWPEVRKICRRESIRLYRAKAPFHGRITRFWGVVVIQINRTLSEKERTAVAMHELAHFWRGDLDTLDTEAYYADPKEDPREQFADLFARYATQNCLPGGSEEA